MKSKPKTVKELAMEERNNNQVLIHQRKDRPQCLTANGFLICYCGKCEPKDYDLPIDYPKNI